MGTDHGQAVSGSSLRRWRAVVLLAAGLAIGVAMTATPVSGHIGSSVTHLWNAHIKPKTDARYYTKARADARYLPRAAKAADAELLDGLNSTAFLGSAAKAADAELLDGLNSTAFLGSAAKAADAELLDGLNSTELIRGNGLAVGRTVDIAVNAFAQIISVPGVLVLTYQCAVGGGTLVLANASADSMSFVIEIAGSSFFQELSAGNATELGPPVVDSIHIQGHSPSAGVVTADVGVALRATDCHTQAQVVVTR